MAMPLRLVRLIDITDGAMEKLVQEVVDARLQAAPPEGTIYRGDVPDISNGEEEAHWQKIIDARTEALRPKHMRLDQGDGGEIIPPLPEVPVEENPVETTETIVDESVVEAPVETPTITEENNPEHQMSAKFCDSCNGVRKHKVYCIKK